MSGFYVVRIERIRVGKPYDSATEASRAASDLSGMTGNEYAVAYDGYPFDRIEEAD
jgi:hypothetical protein